MGLYSRYTTDKDGKRVRKDDATIRKEEMPKEKKEAPKKEAPKKESKKESKKSPKKD